MNEQQELPNKHKPGALNTLWEHKFILSSFIIIFLMFVLKESIDKDIIMLFVLLAVLILFFSLFVELPHSRYPALQLIGHLAWYIAIFSSLFFGWLRWANPD